MLSGVPQITPRSVHDLSLMGVSHVMTAPGERIDVPPSFRRVYHGRDATVWQNRSALPRAYATYGVEALPGADQALQRVTDLAFNAKSATVVEAPAAEGNPVRRPEPIPVRLVSDEPERVELAAEMDRPGVVVLADSYSSGWRVTVDGREAEPLRANYLYRAVAVPAGRHVVEWRYRPPAVVAGLVISALAALGGLLLAIYLTARRAKREA